MRCIVVGVFLCLLAGHSAAAEDEFTPAMRIEADDGPIDVGGFQAPRHASETLTATA